MNTEIQETAGTKLTFIMPDTNSIGKLNDMEVKYDLNIKYKSADDWATLKDKPVRAFYMGLKEVPSSDGVLVTCGMFATEREVFIAGQMTLVEAVKSLPPSDGQIKTAVEITYRGKKQNISSDGKTMLFDVKKLG